MAITMAGGKAGDGNSDSKNSVGQGTETATKRAMATAIRVAGDKEGKDSKVGKGKVNGNEGGGQQKGQ